IYGRFGHLICCGENPLFELSLQERFEGADVVLTEVVVLEENRVFCSGQCLVEELGVNSSLSMVAYQTGRRQRIFGYVGEFAGATDDRDRGNALALEILRRRRIAGSAELAEDE